MRIKLSKPSVHILYWLFVLLILTVIFGRSWNNVSHAVYFISMLLPVVVGTSYFINYFLVPRFLLTRRFFKFGLYFFYTLIVSLYLELIVLLLSFIYLANFNLGDMSPNAWDTMLMGIVMYLLVFIGSFLVMMQQWNESQKALKKLILEKEKSEKNYIIVRSQRKTINLALDSIKYIESFGDYVIFRLKDQDIRSKEPISKLNDRLPKNFIRIHRSFIINSDFISEIHSDQVFVGTNAINIGRKYKQSVLEQIHL